MECQEYIKSELLVLVPVLYIIGLGLKKSKLADKNQHSPFIIMINASLSNAVVAPTPPTHLGKIGRNSCK